MGGSQVLLADVEPQQTVAFLTDAIKTQLGHVGHLRLARRDGMLLNDAAASIGDCLL